MSRRRSQSEDDHPPSPVTMEHASESSGSHFLSHSRTASSASPAGARGDLSGLRFHAPLTPSGSNPHTPASPHMGHNPQVVSSASSVQVSCSDCVVVLTGPVATARVRIQSGDVVLLFGVTTVASGFRGSEPIAVDVAPSIAGSPGQCVRHCELALSEPAPRAEPRRNAPHPVAEPSRDGRRTAQRRKQPVPAAEPRLPGAEHVAGVSRNAASVSGSSGRTAIGSGKSSQSPRWPKRHSRPGVCLARFASAVVGRCSAHCFDSRSVRCPLHAQLFAR